MEKQKTYYSTFSIQGKSGDEIFRELCTDKEYNKLNEVTWKEAFINLFGEMLDNVPNPRTIAANVVNRGLIKKGLHEIDCENTYFNKFGSEVISDHHYNHDLGLSYPRNRCLFDECFC